MRFFCFCFFAVLIQAQVHRTQIIQTYIYEINARDFGQKEEKDSIIITLFSTPLIQFMTDQSNATNYTQSVRFNDAYTEFKSFNQNISLYTNTHNVKLNFNLSHSLFELVKIDETNYLLKNATAPIKNPSECKFIVQKTLSSQSDTKKDFVINLDNQYYFSKLLATHNFLQCVRD